MINDNSNNNNSSNNNNNKSLSVELFINLTLLLFVGLSCRKDIAEVSIMQTCVYLQSYIPSYIPR